MTVHPLSVVNSLDFLNRVNRIPHYVWSPYTGEVIQSLPLDVAGKQYGKEINRGGSPCIQIAVCLGEGTGGLTDTLCEGLEGLLETLKLFGVPETFPMGVPSPWGTSWSLLGAFPKAGHYSSNQIDPSMTGIGRLDVKRFFGGDSIE